MSTGTPSMRAAPTSGPARAAVVTAAVLGLVHAGFSAFWMLGGTWLLETLGEQVLTTFDGRLWLLAPVVLVKVVAALAPLALVAGTGARTGTDSRARWRRLLRALSWLGSGVLVVWGGANTVVSNLVLAGVIEVGGPIDRPAVIGHAWLWDPLFLAWGAALAVGLWLTRPARAEPRPRPGARRPAAG
ncbi:DUF3995 domain-containing protein [Serinibacter arcticus]|uniref:DUF3995 domain-containing protein n=1 Tax=Serinibacter arcticus TaxID=1655435 RepID=UPI001E3B87A3|nr:DUF3995 domain-containing protein [Serinibacter arcticus]